MAVPGVGKRLCTEPVPTIALDKECLGVTVAEILLTLLFTNLKLIGVTSLVELSAVRWDWGERLDFQNTSFLNVIFGCLFRYDF